jgi:uncharacterized protein (TIGR00266 family)
MKIEVINGGRDGSGAFASLRVGLKKGESITCEADAMTTRTEGIRLGVASSSFGKTVCRCLCTRQSMFFQSLSADEKHAGDDEVVELAPKLPGGIVVLRLQQNAIDLLVRSGSFLACEPSVQLGHEFTTCRNACCGGAGMVLIKASGNGAIAFSSFGPMKPHVLAEDEKLFVDTAHAVAWSSDIKYDVKMANKSFSTAFVSGEGMTMCFTGPGVVYVQSHSSASLASMISKPQQNKLTARGCCGLLVIVAIFIALIGLGILAPEHF